MFVMMFLKTKMNFYSQKEIVFVSCLVNHFHIRQTLKIEFFSVLNIVKSNISKTQFFFSQKINKILLIYFVTLFKSSRDMFYSRGFVKRESAKKPQKHKSYLVTTMAR